MMDRWIETERELVAAGGWPRLLTPLERANMLAWLASAGPVNASRTWACAALATDGDVRQAWTCWLVARGGLPPRRDGGESSQRDLYFEMYERGALVVRSPVWGIHDLRRACAAVDG